MGGIILVFSQKRLMGCRSRLAAHEIPKEPERPLTTPSTIAPAALAVPLERAKRGSITLGLLRAGVLRRLMHKFLRVPLSQKPAWSPAQPEKADN